MTMTATTPTNISSWIEGQIAAGVLSPGARSMSPEAAATQYNEANSLTPADSGYLVAPAQGQARSDNQMPRVFVTCMACAGAYGATAGVWVDADDVADLDILTVHEGAELRIDPELCEEMWIGEHELPTEGGMSPYDAALWGETYAAVDGYQRQAFTAWITSGAFEEDGDGMPSVGAFSDRYRGTWPDFATYAYDAAYESFCLSEADEELVRYFSFERHARDLEMDYTIADAPDGAVYVFRDH